MGLDSGQVDEKQESAKEVAGKTIGKMGQRARLAQTLKGLKK